jgi:hypothetical protein
VPCVATVLPCIAISPRSKPSSFSTGTIRGCHSHRFGMTHWMPLTAANGGACGEALPFELDTRKQEGPLAARALWPAASNRAFRVSENVDCCVLKGLEPHFPQVNGIVYIHIHYIYIDHIY